MYGDAHGPRRQLVRGRFRRHKRNVKINLNGGQQLQRRYQKGLYTNPQADDRGQRPAAHVLHRGCERARRRQSHIHGQARRRKGQRRVRHRRHREPCRPHPATADTDYTQTNRGPLNFKKNETSKTFVVAITDDNIDEPDETFAVTLSNPVDNQGLPKPAIATDGKTAVGTIDRQRRHAHRHASF